MLSTFPPTFFFDSFLGNPFPPSEPCFPASEITEPAAFSPQPPQFVNTTNSGSDESNQDASNFTEPDRANNSKTLTSGPAVDHDDRKRRRMESNRKSAQRSRMRRQRHVENLTNLAARFKLVNRELTNRLRYTLQHTQTFASENESLQAEAALLRERLSSIRNLLLLRHVQRHYLNPSAMAAATTSAWPCISNAAAPPLTPHQNYCTNII